MAFIDPDYVDMSRIGDEVIENVMSDGSLVSDVVSGGSRRGKDVPLYEIADFKDNDEFKDSEIKAEIDEFMTRRKIWKTDFANNESYYCKYNNKRGFKQCPRQLKICFVSTCHKIVVFSNMEDHCHEEDLSHVTKTNYHWTSRQIAVIENHIKYTGKNNNKIILAQLKEEGLTNGGCQYPTLAQVGTKKN